MTYTLSAEYIAEARARAYRYQGQWCGTAGGLAADVARLLIERKTMQDSIQTLSDHNEAMMSASEGCCGGGKCHPKAAIVEDAPGRWREMTKASAEKYAADREEAVPVDWILQGQKEMDATTDDVRWSGDSILADHGDDVRPASNGTTSKFGTGAVRSDTFEEFRYDLVSPIGLREVARACAEGAEKYGDWNWEKGMPAHDLLNHAIAHIYGFLSGDRSEQHLGHAAWNLLAAIHSHELWPHINKDTLRGQKCSPPAC